MHRLKWWRTRCRNPVSARKSGQFLRSLGLEFWLPLPLLGLVFWGVTGLVTEQSLEYSNQFIESFQITAKQAQPSSKILFIKVTVDRDRNVSLVKVTRATPAYQMQEYKLATTESEQVETAISQKLGLSPEEVRQRLRYQLKK